MSDGASKGLVSALSSENFQLIKEKCSYVEKWEWTLNGKSCPRQSPFLGTSLTLVSVPSAICQGAWLKRAACGRMGHLAPSGEHIALASVLSFSTPTIAGEFVLLVVKS